MGENIKSIVMHSGLSNQALTTISREDYERYCMGAWHSDEAEMKEEKKVNKFLEIKEGQEIDKIEEKYKEEKKALIAVDRINKILLETKEYINKIYEEERDAKRFSFDMEYYIAKETKEKIDELRKEKDGKVATIKMKYAEVAALVEDMPAKDRIPIYMQYEIM